MLHRLTLWLADRVIPPTAVRLPRHPRAYDACYQRYVAAIEQDAPTH